MTDHQGCIQGCIKRGQHLDDCDTHAECGHLTKSQRDQCTGGCRGCLPRPATEGQLCTTCHTRMRDWFSDGPNSLRAALGHLTDALRGFAPGIDYNRDPGHTDDGPPAPLQLDRYDCRQLILDRIFIYEEAIREAFNRDQRTQPRPRALLAGAAWDRDAGDSMATFDPVTALRFLNSWLTRIEDDADPDLLNEMWDRFCESMVCAHSLVPWRAEIRYCEGVACPECGQKRLVIHGGEDSVTCRYCDSVFTRTAYDRWTALLSWKKQQDGAPKEAA